MNRQLAPSDRGPEWLGMALTLSGTIGATRMAADMTLPGGLPDTMRCLSRTHFDVRCPLCGVTGSFRGALTGNWELAFRYPFALALVALFAFGIAAFGLRLLLADRAIPTFTKPLLILLLLASTANFLNQFFDGVSPIGGA